MSAKTDSKTENKDAGAEVMAGDGQENQVARQEAIIIRQIARQRKARIIIPSGRDAHERCPVMVGLNGREFLIERDKPVDVPEGVLNVLKLSIANVARTVDNGEFARTEFHKAPRYPFQMLGYVNAGGELENA